MGCARKASLPMAVAVLRILPLALAALTAQGSRLSKGPGATSLPAGASFGEYVAAMGRGYVPDSEEWELRERLFKQRAEEVRLQNARPDRRWTAQLNSLSDRTDEELARLRGWRHRPEAPGALGGAAVLVGGGHRVGLANTSLPAVVDWSHLQTAEVNEDQGACGSCWASASTKMMETRYEIAMQEPRTFSTQQLVDCVRNERNCGGTGGCEGATAELAMSYVQSQGLSTEEEYPYTAVEGTCQPSQSSLLAAGEGENFVGAATIGMTGWSLLPSNAARPLMEALLEGPVAVALAADTIISYWTGIFDSCPKDSVINHAVAMIGYGEESETKYWTIQNSWGLYWGENGRMRVMRMDTPEADDAWCGMDTRPEDGVECIPYPDAVRVCGMCGILYDSVVVHFSNTALANSSGASAGEAPQAATLRQVGLRGAAVP